ncbi:50S ribosomal protein L25/general stress protein Ctc [Microbacterium kribbense]|uniref:Large ribosomal subunit protein bL25 n=1 Tax=Microbacterium kribbense TaxID=433645 RepID=A0ABP7GID5_9MICO
MSDDTNVHAELRENFGKGFARRLRAAGKVPAVIYGHGTDPVHVALPGHQLSLLLRRANALLDLEVGGTQQLTLVKDVQRDPVRQIIEHVDLLVVKKGEKVHVEVPIVVVGEPVAGTIVNLDAVTIKLQVEATHIPQHVEVDVTGLDDGARITAADVVLPKGAVLSDEADLLMVAISIPAAGIDETDEAETAETAAVVEDAAE